MYRIGEDFIQPFFNQVDLGANSLNSSVEPREIQNQEMIRPLEIAEVERNLPERQSHDELRLSPSRDNVKLEVVEEQHAADDNVPPKKSKKIVRSS